MPAPRLGLVGAATAGGLQEFLVRRAMLAKQAEQEAYERSQAERKQAEIERANRAGEGLGGRKLDVETELGRGNLDVSRGNLALGNRRVDVDESQFNALAPERTARIDLMGAQTRDINNRPLMAGVEFDRDLQKIKEQGASQLRVAMARPRSTQMVPVQGPDGTIRYMNEENAGGQIVGRQTAPRPVTGQDRQTLAFYNRAKEADAIAAPLDDQIAKMSLIEQAGLQYLPNFLQTKAGQNYRQAQRAFTEARLRKESGAAVPESEYQNDAKTYFAQPGDTPEVLAQKKAGRQEVLDGIGFASGGAFEEFYGSPFQRNAPSAGAGRVPPEVEAVLKAAQPGRHTLSDGSVWIKAQDGSIKKGGE